LFYPRKKALSRVAQLFMTQLRQVEAGVQAREQRALQRLEGPPRGRRGGARRKTKSTREPGKPARRRKAAANPRTNP
jgi:hypothetical protein